MYLKKINDPNLCKLGRKQANGDSFFFNRACVILVFLMTDLCVFSIFFVEGKMVNDDKKYWILTNQISVSLTARLSLNIPD